MSNLRYPSLRKPQCHNYLSSTLGIGPCAVAWLGTAPLGVSVHKPVWRADDAHILFRPPGCQPLSPVSGQNGINSKPSTESCQQKTINSKPSTTNCQHQAVNRPTRSLPHIMCWCCSRSDNRHGCSSSRKSGQNNCPRPVLPQHRTRQKRYPLSHNRP